MHTIFGPFDSCKAEIWTIVRDVCIAESEINTLTDGDKSVETTTYGAVACSLQCTYYNSLNEAKAVYDDKYTNSKTTHQTA